MARVWGQLMHRSSEVNGLKSCIRAVSRHLIIIIKNTFFNREFLKVSYSHCYQNKWVTVNFHWQIKSNNSCISHMFDCISHVFWLYQPCVLTHQNEMCNFCRGLNKHYCLTFGSNWPYSLRGEHWNVKSIQMTDGCQKLTWPFGSAELISGSFSNTKGLWVYTCTC